MSHILRAGLGLSMAALIPLSAAALDYPSPLDSNANYITISCFRGPLPVVVWDRPNAVFVDDLVQYGYAYPQAYSIAETVCRDEYAVGNKGYMTQRLYELMNETPPVR
ncbi:MAG: hypothetical protein CML68_22270 [Rhodobacteraceae bacterium]|nr:hypothetical protein [Paracoccaceae bacterium]